MNSVKQKTILLIEDEEMFAITEINFLENCGYSVLYASSSSTAMEFVKENSNIDLILMDIDLGETVDGAKLAERILELREIPILFLSNYTDPDTKNKAKSISSYGFILKSSAPFVLDTSIEMALNLFAEKQATKHKDEKLKDITDRLKKAHIDLLQRQFAIDQHAIVAITNLAGTILYVNNRFCEISQYSYYELVGKNHRIVNSGYHDEQFWQKMYSTLKKGNVWHGEIRNRAKDGSIYWVATTIAPLENTDGKIYQYLALRTVITERKEAEEKLRLHQIELETQKTKLEIAYSELKSTQLRYYDLFEVAPVGYLTVSDDGIILEVNLTLAVLLGTSRTNLLNKSILQYIYKKDQKICHAHKNRLFQTAIPQSFEVRMQKENGKFFWARLDATLRMDTTGNLKCRIAITDFTKRKELEMKLQEYRKDLENLNRTKDKFFHIIAHDLRNPFAGIIGISELLEKNLIEKNIEQDSKLLQYTKMIQTSSKSAFNLLENLLLWAGTQTGEITIRRTILPINHLINLTIPIVNGNAFNKNITIETKFSDNDNVYADESLVNTILRNLITNAIKFTYPGGKIIVSTKDIDGFLEISISDTGVGIHPKHLESIFRIDSKTSKPGTNKEKGSGLGLILCNEFVTQQGGKIWVTSQLGAGSIFTFTLPLAASVRVITSNSTLPVSSSLKAP